MPGTAISIESPKDFATALRFTEEMLYVSLSDGREIGVPLAWFPTLQDARPEQRQQYRLIGKGVGIHWPELDEDILVSRLINP